MGRPRRVNSDPYTRIVSHLDAEYPMAREPHSYKSGTANAHVGEKGREVSIRSLKSWAVEKLPSASKLRSLILAEPESMDPQEYCSKVQTWLLLAKEDV